MKKSDAPSKDVPSEQELKNIEQRTQMVRMARENGVNPKELEGKTPAEVNEHLRQVQAALSKAKTTGNKNKHILDGKVVAKKLEAKLNKIRKKFGN